MTYRYTLLPLLIASLVACSEQRPSPVKKESPVASGTPGEQNGHNARAVMMPMPPMPIMPPVAAPGTPPVATPPVTTPPVTAPIIQTSYQGLPLLVDADGNPNDAFATYNLSVNSGVPVGVITPAGGWITPMMRYNGLQQPPVIKVKRGTTVTVNVQNGLTEDTTVHWHGFKIPASQDGGPDGPIPAGGSRTYSFKIQQAAAPLWFHPHAHGTTATQVYNGLAGAFIVTDAITDLLEATAQIPKGDYDIPLLIQDRTFGPDNGAGVRPLVYSNNMMTGMTGMLGDTILVNGVGQPTLNVETRQYRLRLFNGSNARTYDFALSNGALFKVVGTDGGLLPSPVSTDHVVLAAGERAEIVVDFRSSILNDSVSLINRSTANLEVMRFNVAMQAIDNVNLYASLPTNAEIYNRLNVTDANNSRNFIMSMGNMMAPGGMSFVINGKSFDINRVDELVASGSTEVWAISNTSAIAHPFHAHAIQWQVLDRGGIPANGVDLGWKDTVLVQPGETVRIIGKFDPTINQGLYMYHCHILEHEDNGMMGTFMIQ